MEPILLMLREEHYDAFESVIFPEAYMKLLDPNVYAIGIGEEGTGGVEIGEESTGLEATVIGALVFELVEEEEMVRAEILSLAISPSFRGRHYAARLIDELMYICGGMGVDEISASCLMSPIDAIPLQYAFLNRGFTSARGGRTQVRLKMRNFRGCGLERRLKRMEDLRKPPEVVSLRMLSTKQEQEFMAQANLGPYEAAIVDRDLSYVTVANGMVDGYCLTTAYGGFYEVYLINSISDVGKAAMTAFFATAAAIVARATDDDTTVFSAMDETAMRFTKTLLQDCRVTVIYETQWCYRLPVKENPGENQERTDDDESIGG